MKKLILFSTALLLLATTVSAQDWKEALTKAATNVADQVTGGKLTELAIAGTWNYSAPATRFEGDNTTSQVTGALVETSAKKKLTTIYNYVGIKPGACSFTFNQDKTFTSTMGKRQLTGTYEFDASTHLITLHFNKGILNTGSMNGHVYISGTELTLVFPVTKMVNLLTSLGSKVSQLTTISSFFKQYDNVYIGFAFAK